MRAPKNSCKAHTLRRGLCILLASVMLVGSLAACTNTPVPSEPDTTADAADTHDPSDTDEIADPMSTDDATAPSESDPAFEETPPANGEDTLEPTESVAPPDTEAPSTEPDGAPITLPPETVAEPETAASELPRLDIVTRKGQSITSKDHYVQSTVTLSNCHESYAFSEVGAQLRVRGNSTAGAPKKPYRVKFDVKQELLGLSGGRAFRNWCLMADYYDGSMLRTYGTFRFAEALMGGEYFSSDCTHMEVYVNGEYQGVYLLCEQTQIHKYRINIPELSEGDTSLEQGYLLIGQGGRTDEPGTVVVHPEITVRDREGQEMYFGSMNFALSGGEYTDAQKQYVSRYVSGVFKVVAKAVYDHEYYSLARDGTMTRIRKFEWAKTDEEKQIETVSRVFNLESAVSMCILDEIVKNLDAMTFNMYVDLSPGGDGVLTLAAPWDFDFSMANTHYGTTHSSNGFYATNLSYSEGMRTNLWYVMLGSIDWFDEMVKDKWQESYIALQSVVSDLIGVNHAYDAAFNRDFERWGLPKDRSLIHHHAQADLAGFDEHIKAGEFVTNWLSRRLVWLNRQWGDGVSDPSAEAVPDLQLLFKNESDTALITGVKRCEVTVTSQGLKLTPDSEARDPYFSFDYGLLGEQYEAEDHHVLEFTYRIPTEASAASFVTELFLCAGSVQNPTGGVSTTVRTVADGQWHTVSIELADTGYWEGIIHVIRLDFFSSCEVGDTMYLKDFKLLPQ